MVHILENPVMMTYEEMRSMFDGKWIYVAKCEYTLGDSLIRGMPVVAADMQFEDVDSGIYKKFKTGEYGKTLSLSFFGYVWNNPFGMVGVKHDTI